MSLAHWMRARLFPLPPRTNRDISAISKAMRLAAPMMSFPWKHNQTLLKDCCGRSAAKSKGTATQRLLRIHKGFSGECSLTLLDHLRASSWSCRAATIIGSFTISPAFCSGNSSSFSSGGGGLGGGTSPSGRGGLGGAASSLSCKGNLLFFNSFVECFQRCSNVKLVFIEGFTLS